MYPFILDNKVKISLLTYMLTFFFRKSAGLQVSDYKCVNYKSHIKFSKSDLFLSVDMLYSESFLLYLTFRLCS